MAKELIVSVNGREKKIAIIENEQVTEFYIERGEENQGIVGNIYKGRVMRVLPGMQSAFVDIGLERDAFLYVSDFFDEEEEFERIVMDKSKKGDAAEAERVARERIQQARLEREHQIEATHERAEPLADASATTEGGWEPDVTPQQAPAISGEADSAIQSASSVSAEEAGRKRGRRGKRRGKGDIDVAESPAIEPEKKSFLLVTEEVETPFATAGSDFQRVVDEDERAAAEDGAMFKDARLQERIFNQIHAVEFDIDETPTAEVGSLIGSASTQNDASFQRIDDSDIAASGGLPPATNIRKPVAAHVSTFIDDVEQESIATQSFERVSDDEGAPEPEIETAKRGRATSTRKRSEDSTDDGDKPVRGRASARKPAAKGAPKKAAPARSGAKKSTSRSTSKGKKIDVSSGEEGDIDVAVLEGESERDERADLIASDARGPGAF